MAIIRSEQPTDFATVYRVNTLAFGSEAEAKLVNALRDARTYLAFVAEQEDQIVGHISFSAVTLDDRTTKFLGLAPMSVLPAVQSRGIGSALVTEGLKLCADAGYTAVFVLGHAHYYPRFGFVPATSRGFTCEYPVPNDLFMVLELVPGSLEGKSGLIKYGPEFANV